MNNSFTVSAESTLALFGSGGAAMSAQPLETRIAVKGNATKYVKLNVGGALFNTTLGTLTKHDNMLRAMFSGRMEVLTDTDGKGIGRIRKCRCSGV